MSLEDTHTDPPGPQGLPPRHQSSRTRVYRYGLLAPVEQAESVRDQLHAAHRYRNKLTEIERERRKEARAIWATYDDVRSLSEDVAKARALLDELRDTIKRARASTRSRSDTEEMRTAAKEARAALHLARSRLAERRRQLREDLDLQLRQEKVNDDASAKRRDERAKCGVYWGSYLLVEADADAARKMPLFDGDEPNDPRFVGWRGEGRIGVQLQGGEDASGLVGGGDSRLRIDAVDPLAWTSPTRGVRRRLCRTTLRLRIGSTGPGNKEPVWATWPMLMHRPLPEGGVVKWAVVELKKCGPREVWSLLITVDIPAPAPTSNVHVAAVDLGWRAMDDGIRVATWQADNGEHGEFRMPMRTVTGIHKADELRSTRDQNFNEARAKLVAWFRDRADLPDWMIEAKATLHAWRSAGRLATLALKWRESRWEGDAEGYEPLEAWRYHDHHLWQWETSQRKKALGRRRNEYRVWAASMAQRFGVLVLEDFDLRAFAKHQVTETAKGEIQSARSTRAATAPHELRSALVNVFDRVGARVVKVPQEYTTVTCNACTKVCAFDKIKLTHECEFCGAKWDQDENAARNLLERYREWLGGEQNTAGARSDETSNEDKVVKGSKWATAKAAKAAKLADREAARKQVANAATSDAE